MFWQQDNLSKTFAFVSLRISVIKFNKMFRQSRPYLNIRNYLYVLTVKLGTAATRLEKAKSFIFLSILKIRIETIVTTFCHPVTASSIYGCAGPRLYCRHCRLVDRSVGRSVGRSFGWSFGRSIGSVGLSVG